jgi:hypothetical protein
MSTGMAGAGRDIFSSQSAVDLQNQEATNKLGTWHEQATSALKLSMDSLMAQRTAVQTGASSVDAGYLNTQQNIQYNYETTKTQIQSDLINTEVKGTIGIAGTVFGTAVQMGDIWSGMSTAEQASSWLREPMSAMTGTSQTMSNYFSRADSINAGFKNINNGPTDSYGKVKNSVAILSMPEINKYPKSQFDVNKNSIDLNMLNAQFGKYPKSPQFDWSSGGF